MLPFFFDLLIIILTKRMSNDIFSHLLMRLNFVNTNWVKLIYEHFSLYKNHIFIIYCDYII